MYLGSIALISLSSSVCACVCVCVCGHVCVVHVCVVVHVSVCMYVSLCMCVCHTTFTLVIRSLEVGGEEEEAATCTCIPSPVY